MYGKSGYGQNSYQQYRAVQVQTASPAQIMLMLYDGAIRFAHVAQQKIDAGDMAGKGTYIGKVQAIVAELMSSLDFSLAPELCAHLQQLYIYMMERLTEANIKVDKEQLDIVIRLLTTLREGWSEALTSLPSDPTIGRRPQPVADGAPPPEAAAPGVPRP